MREIENQSQTRSSSDSHQHRSRSLARAVNGWAAACLGLLFTAHVLLGAALQLAPEMPSSLVWAVWAGVGVAIVHIVLSARTTYTMFKDTERPASSKKKAHQKLKWMTGVLLAAAVVVHQFTLNAASADSWGLLAMVFAAAMLSVHLCTGVKSLTRDMNIPSAARTPIKLFSIVCFCIACALLIASRL